MQNLKEVVVEGVRMNQLAHDLDGAGVVGLNVFVQNLEGAGVVELNLFV